MIDATKDANGGFVVMATAGGSGGGPVYIASVGGVAEDEGLTT